MLYTALHDVAQTIALVVDKKSFDNIEIYIGARDFQETILSPPSYWKIQFMAFYQE